MSYGLNYGTYVDDYLYDQYSRYGNYGNGRNQSYQQNDSIFNNSGTKNSQYTCTDGANDGKIGISAVYHLGKGVVNGVVNGVKGMFTDSNGKFSLSKTLLTVGMGALCVAFPAVGAVACGIGAVSGGMQLVNGIKGVSEATKNMSDAQAKEAWENIGEGASTVVGCVAGAKASIGAMKSASTAAKIGTLDDTAQVIDDLTGAVSKADDVATILKKNGINNVDEVLEGVDLTKVDDIVSAINTKGKTSALSQVDDSLTGMKKITETAKALGKDAMSSSKNNMGKAWSKVTSTLDDVSDYRKAKSEYNKANKALKTAQSDAKKGGYKGNYTKAEQDALNAAKETLDGTNIGKRRAARAQVRSEVQTAKADLNDANKALRTAQRDAKKGGYKGNYAKAEQEAVKTAQEALDAARAKTTFGQFKANVTKPITDSATYNYLKPDEKTSVIKMLKDKTYNWTELKKALGSDYKGVIEFLQSDVGDYSKAAKEFGWDKVNQVLYMAYALDQTSMTV